MKKSSTEEQILCARRQVQTGTPSADLCRQPGCSQASFYPFPRVGEVGISPTGVRALATSDWA
jgi:hypothetical protein